MDKPLPDNPTSLLRDILFKCYDRDKGHEDELPVVDYLDMLIDDIQEERWPDMKLLINPDTKQAIPIPGDLPPSASAGTHAVTQLPPES